MDFDPVCLDDGRTVALNAGGENEFGTCLDPDSVGVGFCLQSRACGAAGSALPWHGKRSSVRSPPHTVHTVSAGVNAAVARRGLLSIPCG